MSDENNYKGYDTSIIYDYREYPDVQAGICDNCGNAQFKSSVKNYVFLRECRKCGMKKTI
ncbi:hypothetical protein [Niallia circulans]|uniref:DUF8096 domain-containing protein n=1 Tax=Niallia circulans TaxID=1397 RepID=A0A0J1IAS5_NIACI|nr:hypothetical protein [Niallia circulans]KLV23072.1 hypothetical protein ABW02_20310 [Niallia circulans]MDR4317886.1 hypothetical protein [Niallia circulans]MED3841673.1 hypothetical protein [Niallia circulans]MED4243409.1 hypothetical protein [Niallia circulans]MED4248286.1 hypothetical protein [Niallia circulans]